MAAVGYESDSKNWASSSDEEKDDEHDLTCAELVRYGRRERRKERKGGRKG
jgi:hypothetical protein